MLTAALLTTATVAVLVVAARAAARIADGLHRSTEQAQAELQAGVDDPASAGTDWTWLTGHPSAPRVDTDDWADQPHREASWPS